MRQMLKAYSNTYNIYIIYNDFFKYLLLINPIVVQTPHGLHRKL